VSEFNKEIVKLELWFNDIFLLDYKIDEYIEITEITERLTGLSYTMKMFHCDIEYYILDVLELISGVK